MVLKPCIALGTQLATLSAEAPLTASAAVVHAVLQSPRFSSAGALEGKPWSLSSVYAMLSMRFLGRSSVHDLERITVTAPAHEGVAIIVAACPDGATLLVSTAHKLLQYDVATGALLRVVGDVGTRALQFNLICDISFGPDGRVYVTDRANHRVQVLTDTLEFIGVIDGGKLRNPYACIADEMFVICAGFRKRSGIVVFEFNGEPAKDAGAGRPTLRPLKQLTHFAKTLPRCIVNATFYDPRPVHDPCNALRFVPNKGGIFAAARMWHYAVYVYTPRGVLLQSVILPTASGSPKLMFTPWHELVVTCGNVQDPRSAAVVCLYSGVVEGWLQCDVKCGVGRHIAFAGTNTMVLAPDDYRGHTFVILRCK